MGDATSPKSIGFRISPASNWFVGDCSSVTIPNYDATVILPYLSENLIPLQYRPLPQLEWARVNFVTTHELLNRFQQIKRKVFLVLEEFDVLGAGENPRAQTFLDDDGPTSVLGLIVFWIALAFLFYKGSKCR